MERVLHYALPSSARMQFIRWATSQWKSSRKLNYEYSFRVTFWTIQSCESFSCMETPQEVIRKKRCSWWDTKQINRALTLTNLAATLIFQKSSFQWKKMESRYSADVTFKPFLTILSKVAIK